MNPQIKNILKPELYTLLSSLSETDSIINQVMNNSDNIERFVNALVAAIACIIDREQQSQQMIAAVLQANPEVKKLLEMKNDPSMLPKE